jgi:hypothetical protein
MKPWRERLPRATVLDRAALVAHALMTHRIARLSSRRNNSPYHSATKEFQYRMTPKILLWNFSTLL